MTFSLIRCLIKRLYFFHKYRARVAAGSFVPITTHLDRDATIGRGTVFGDDIVVGEQTRIAENVWLSGPAVIGKKCMIGRDVKVQAERFSLGDYSLIYANSYFDSKRLAAITIGRFSQVASGCEIRNADHDLERVSAYPFRGRLGLGERSQDYRNRGDLVIGNDVWIGHNVSIVNGVTIGDGAVIGAGCVLTTDVPPYAVFAGVPGRLVKYRFDKDRINQLLNLRWWDWDEVTIKKSLKMLTSAPGEWDLLVGCD